MAGKVGLFPESYIQLTPLASEPRLLMVEYVYARHDFIPEHEDEIPFRAGERIEVIEKEEVYGDSWWKVCPYSFVRP